MFKKILIGVIRPLIKVILEDEVSKRVKLEVESELKRQIKNLNPVQKVEILKANNKGLGGLIEFLGTPKLDITSISYKITAKSQMDTYEYYERKFSSVAKFFNAMTPSNIPKLTTSLEAEDFKYITDLDIRVRFNYKDKETSKGFVIINSDTDVKSVVAQTKRIYKAIDKHLIEMTI